MFTFLLLVILGCLLGVITGLTPGLHVNTLCIIGLGVYPLIGLDGLQFGVAITAMSVTHTFLDFIPAIFLGVPEEQTALSVLPTHKLLLEGRSYEAVKLTAFGSLIGLFTSLLFFLPAIFIIPYIYTALRPFIVYIISFAAFILIFREKQKVIFAAFIFLLTGWLGYTIFHMKALSSSQVLFPVFTGLFGLSTIILSLNQKQKFIPQKPYANVKIDKSVFSSGLIGSVGGIVVGLLPSLSPSQIGVLMSELYGGSLKKFLVSVSAINTSDAIYSLVALYAIGNPRSGVAVMLSKIINVDYNTLILFIGSMATTAIIATMLHLWIGKKAMLLFNKINYKLCSLGVVAFLIILVLFMTGPLGLYLLILSTIIGMLPPLIGVSRTHLMGVLIIPTLLFFTGFG